MPSEGRAREDRPTEARGRKHVAGLFDIRNVIGLLLGIYGLILLFMGIFGDKSLDRTGGVNANLWAAIVLLIVSAVMLLWARFRPTYVPEGAAEEAGGEPAV
ncbi:hypothetical protein Rai3103_04295 [Raineyella fluvialis]|uniref:Uncharacterized protein n=2 Tax=Raineyella fluvialis TaxID=2662261 RepID=A0A5Q2FL48_9ACTN|nr:hypothetical protein Rai3103_04295 [Raineyella fluvialis]